MKTIVTLLTALSLGVSATWARVNPASPIFAERNATHVASLDRVGVSYAGLKTLDGGAEYLGFARALGMEAPQVAPAQNPASLSVSLCLGSACVGSICLGSACTASFCFGSACGTSKCGGSACVTSVCGGSACGASVCGGSACLGSACVGSICIGPCGPESFPVVRACDYTIDQDGIVLSLGVDKASKLAAGSRTYQLAKDRINQVRISGSYVGAEFKATESGMTIVLRTETGEARELQVAG